MKKLLYFISATTIFCGTAISTTNYYSIKLQANNVIWYAPNSMENLINDIDNAVGDVNWVSRNDYDTSMEKHVQEQYDKFISNNEGIVTSVMVPVKVDSTIVYVGANKFTNNTSLVQTFLTLAYSLDINNLQSFTSYLPEKNAVVDTSFKVPFINDLQFNAKLTSTSKWTGTQITEETLANKSQSIEVPPKSKVMVDILFKQETYHNKGLISFKVDLDDTISSLYYFDDNHNWATTNFTMKEIIEILVQHGYGEQIKNTSSEYSIISTDDPVNPSEVNLNLPVSWETQQGKIEVVVQEEL